MLRQKEQLQQPPNNTRPVKAALHLLNPPQGGRRPLAPCGSPLRTRLAGGPSAAAPLLVSGTVGSVPPCTPAHVTERVAAEGRETYTPFCTRLNRGHWTIHENTARHKTFSFCSGLERTSNTAVYGQKCCCRVGLFSFVPKWDRHRPYYLLYQSWVGKLLGTPQRG